MVSLPPPSQEVPSGGVAVTTASPNLMSGASKRHAEELSTDGAALKCPRMVSTR